MSTPAAPEPTPQLPTHATTRLTTCLAELGVVWPADALRRLEARERAGIVRLAVLGNIKSGKSTVLNALLGADLLPTRSAACSAHPTFVRLAPFDGTLARTDAGANGTCVLARGLASPAALLTEETAEARAGRRATTRRYHFAWPAPGLPEGDSAQLELIDTPGANEMEGLGLSREALRDLIRDAVLEADGLLFVLNAANLADDANGELLAWAAEARPDLVPGGLAFVLNQIDRRTAADPPLAELLGRVAQLAAAWGAPKAPIYPLSAQHALLGRLMRRGEASEALAREAQGVPWPRLEEGAGGRQVMEVDEALGERLEAASGILALTREAIGPWLAHDTTSAARRRLAAWLGEAARAGLAACADGLAERRRHAEAEQRLGSHRDRRLLAALDELSLAEREVTRLCSRDYVAGRVQAVVPILYRTPAPCSVPGRLRVTGSLREAVRPYLERDLAQALLEARQEVASHQAECEQALRRLAVGRPSPVSVSIWAEGIEPGDAFDPLTSRKPPEEREFERVFGDATFDDAMADIAARASALLDGNPGDADLEALALLGQEQELETLARLAQEGGLFDEAPPLSEPQGVARMVQVLDEAHEAVHTCLAASPCESGIPRPRSPMPPGTPALSLGHRETDALLAAALGPHALPRYLALVDETADGFDVAEAYALLAAEAGGAIAAAQEALQADLIAQLAGYLTDVAQGARQALEAIREHLAHEQAMRAAKARALAAELAALHTDEARAAEAGPLLDRALPLPTR